MCHIDKEECAHVDVKSNFLWNEKMYFECPCRLQNRIDKPEYLVKLKLKTSFNFVTRTLKGRFWSNNKIELTFPDSLTC